jgi:hypothetical protein
MKPTNSLTLKSCVYIQLVRTDMFLYILIIFRECIVLLMLNKSLEMIKLDRNMSEF